MEWEVKYYVSNRGERVVETFLERQDEAAIQKAYDLFDMMEYHGPNLRMPHSRYLGGKLYELRIIGNSSIRIFYTVVPVRNQIILLHAFKKKAQKLPLKELMIAKKRQRALTEL